jgi:N-acetylmuramoyl-L-alanine amidase
MFRTRRDETMARGAGRRLPSGATLGGLVAAAVLLAAGSAAIAAEAAAPAQVERVRYESDGGHTRVVIVLSRAVPHEVRVLPGDPVRGSGERLVVDFSNARLGPAARVPIGAENGVLQRIRTGQFTARTARVVLDLGAKSMHEVTGFDDPARVVIDVTATDLPVPAAVAERPLAKARVADERPARGAPSPRLGGEGPASDTAVRVKADAPPPPMPQGSSAVVLSALPSGGTAVARGDAGPPARARPSTLSEETLGPGTRETTAEPSGAATRQDPAALAATAARAPEVADVAPPAAAPSAKPAPPPVTEASTPWRIVLDPGHGGNDPGARGVTGMLEKDVTLHIARELKQRLERELHATVLLTRDRDVTRSLAERTAFANASRADLFISIHANADAAGRLHGIETYTLNNSNDRATMRLAKMENGPQLRLGRGDLSFILSDMVQSSKEEESIALAQRLHSRLLSQLRAHYPDIRNLGVKKGPFYVLVGAYMPCVLVETSFISHPVEGQRLASEEYQVEIAEGLFLGVKDFLEDARLAKTL